MALQAVISGIGQYLPKKCVKNSDLPAHLGTSDEWIQTRTGIAQRHVADETEKTSFMATEAAREALADAGIDIADIDAIIVATTSPDNGFPATATRVQSLLGAKRAFAFDVQAVCSGFVYGLSVANNFIKTGQARKILLIGAESMSRIVDWNDRSTCVLFGDGAAAIVLQASEQTDRGVLSTHLFSDGDGYDLLFVDHAIETPEGRGAICMNGREIFKSAVRKLGEAVEKALTANQLTISDIDWFVPHQANLRIIRGVIEHFKLPEEKVVITVDQHANTSAASIPLAMYTAVKDGRIQQGHKLVIEAMGGGLTWGSAVIVW